MAKQYNVTRFMPQGITSYEKAVNAIASLDFVALSEQLRPGITYQDLPREQFLSGMKNAIDKFILLGETNLDVIPGHCTLCFPNKEVLCFIGPVSKAFLSVLIEKDELGRITDMFHCSRFCPVNPTITIDRESQEQINIIP